MRRTYKRCNSKGFTLVEMMLVIAIIIILASSVIFGVSGYLNSANKAEADINQQSSELVSHIDASESLLEYYGF